MSLTVCVDASFVAQLILPEQGSERADRLWHDWLSADAEIIAPQLLPYEVTSVIRKKVHRRLMTLADGSTALNVFWELAERMVFVPPDELSARAWELAAQHQQPNLYDAYYVALAEHLDCLLWTADDHLRRAMPGVASRVASLTDLH